MSDPIEESSGIIYELSGSTKCGGEMLHLLDFRAGTGKNPDEYRDCLSELEAISQNFDPEEEFSLYFGQSGTPGAMDLIQDLTDYSEKLSELSLAFAKFVKTKE